MALAMNSSGDELPRSLTHGVFIDKAELNSICGKIHDPAIKFDANKLQTETNATMGKILDVVWKNESGLAIDKDADGKPYSATFVQLRNVMGTDCAVFDFIMGPADRPDNSEYLLPLNKVVDGDLTMKMEQRQFPDKLLEDWLEKHAPKKAIKVESGGGGGSSA
jgi:hypothetical protein